MIDFLYSLWNKSFKYQLIYGFGTVLTILIISFTYINVKYQNDFLKQSGMKQIENRSLSVVKTSKVWVMSNDYVGLEEVINNVSVYDDLVYTAIINLDGKVIAHSDSSLVGKYIADDERINFIEKVMINHNINNKKILLNNNKYIDIIRPIHSNGKHIAFVEMRLDQSVREEAISNTILKGFVFTLISIFVGISFAYFIANGLTKSLSKLMLSVKKFRDGKRDEVADENVVEEISKLAHEFNSLTATLNKSQELNKELTEQLELAFIGSKDGLWDWNIVTNEVYFSPLWKEMIGYEDHELSNELSSWENNIHPDDLEETWNAVNRHIEKETDSYHNIHRLRHKNGHWIWVLDRGKAVYDENGIAMRMVGTHTNITKEKELELKYIHQAQIIEQTADSIISTTLDGTIMNSNYGTQKLLGYKSHELIGKNIELLYPNQNSSLFLESVAILLDTGIFSQDIVLIQKNNKELESSLSLTLLRDEKGAPSSIICYSQDITKRKQIEQELEHQAHHDTLTALPNRLLYHDRLMQAIEKAKRNKTQLAVFFIDLDRFKQINDSLGHNIGDKVLQVVATRLNNIIRKGDTLARLGGDEFTILMEGIHQSGDASILADKILTSLVRPMEIEDHTLYVSSSIGISLYPDDDTDAINLLKYADAAMYKAKEEGRDNFQFYSAEMTKLATEHITLEGSLRDALVNEEFIVYYQSQVDGENDKIIGMEALVRWKHPEKGLISPFKFIPIAEETGLIIQLDQWVMKTAMKQFVQWYKDGYNPGRLALNLAMKQLQHKDFISMLQSMMKETGCKAKWLELEVTEGQIMTNPEHAIVILKEISDMGIELAVDDFGTGYSSLTYLKRLPINKLKIDQSFVKDLPDDEEDVGITKAVIALSKSLNLNVIAEGVETKEQRDFLVENGCKNIQGYFYCEPMPAQEMQKKLKNK